MSTQRMSPRPSRQAGFTLVELITVILILGVLAAVAIPRYSDLQGKARESKVRAIAGSIKAAAGIAKAQAVATGVSCASATAGTVTLEGRSIALNHCYPQASNFLTAGILAPPTSRATVAGRPPSPPAPPAPSVPCLTSA